MSSIIQRSFRSFSWSAGAQVVVVGIGFARSVLLARLLNVDTFGIYAGATAIVGLLAIPATLGLNGAFLHRAPESEDEDHAAAVYLALQIAATFVWLVLMVAGALIFSSGPTQTAILVITIATVIEMIAYPAVAIIHRRVVIQRLAKLILVQTVVTSGVALLLAWNGVELWALLSSDVISALLAFAACYLWKPYWQPHIAIDHKVIAYYLRFGIPYMASTLVEAALRHLDDLYVRYFVGVSELGYYSRAFTFANYPRNILAQPVSLVTGGAFAELAGDRVRLSKAFFRTSALLVRGSFLIGGLLVVLAPEMVAVLLGDKWLPMVPIFRLFALFTLLDPLRDVLGSLFVALGLPRQLLGYRLAQLGVLVVGLWLLGGRWGAEGVAVAVNLMLATGIVLMFYAVRSRLELRLIRLFGAPAVGLLLGWGILFALYQAGMTPEGVWYALLIKGLIFTLVYGGFLLIVERDELAKMVRTTLAHVRGNRAAQEAVETEVEEWAERKVLTPLDDSERVG